MFSNGDRSLKTTQFLEIASLLKNFMFVILEFDTNKNLHTGRANEDFSANWVTVGNLQWRGFKWSHPVQEQIKGRAALYLIVPSCLLSRSQSALQARKLPSVLVMWHDILTTLALNSNRVLNHHFSTPFHNFWSGSSGNQGFGTCCYRVIYLFLNLGEKGAILWLCSYGIWKSIVRTYRHGTFSCSVILKSLSVVTSIFIWWLKSFLYYVKCPLIWKILSTSLTAQTYVQQRLSKVFLLLSGSLKREKNVLELHQGIILKKLLHDGLAWDLVCWICFDPDYLRSWTKRNGQDKMLRSF